MAEYFCTDCLRHYKDQDEATEHGDLLSHNIDKLRDDVDVEF